MPFKVLEDCEELIFQVYNINRKMPYDAEKYNLIDQLRRASLSVGSCLAEGNERRGKDRIFLWTNAKGSLQEVIFQLNVVNRLRAIYDTRKSVATDFHRIVQRIYKIEVRGTLVLCDKIGAIIYKLIDSQSQSPSQSEKQRTE